MFERGAVALGSADIQERSGDAEPTRGFRDCEQFVGGLRAFFRKGVSINLKLVGCRHIDHFRNAGRAKKEQRPPGAVCAKDDLFA